MGKIHMDEGERERKMETRQAEDQEEEKEKEGEGEEERGGRAGRGGISTRSGSRMGRRLLFTNH